jgi:hypothetical protein
MAYELKLNSGSLFKTNRVGAKTDLDGQALMTCPHCGKDSPWWLRGFKKVTTKGINWISLSFRPKDGKEWTTRDNAEPLEW